MSAIRTISSTIACAVVLAFCALAAGAQAAERPVTRPTRDVDIQYALPVHGPDGQVRTLSERQRWDTQDELLRVDPPSPGVFTVMNYPAHKLLVVREADRSVMVMHTGSASLAPGVSGAAVFDRVDQDHVAGLACTDWRTQDSAGHATTVCLTDDGVLLRAKSGEALLVQATHVAYGPVDPAVFAIPAGYRSVTPAQ